MIFDYLLRTIKNCFKQGEKRDRLSIALNLSWTLQEGLPVERFDTSEQKIS